MSDIVCPSTTVLEKIPSLLEGLNQSGIPLQAAYAEIERALARERHQGVSPDSSPFVRRLQAHTGERTPAAGYLRSILQDHQRRINPPRLPGLSTAPLPPPSALDQSEALTPPARPANGSRQDLKRPRAKRPGDQEPDLPTKKKNRPPAVQGRTEARSATLGRFSPLQDLVAGLAEAATAAFAVRVISNFSAEELARYLPYWKRSVLGTTDAEMAIASQLFAIFRPRVNELLSGIAKEIENSTEDSEFSVLSHLVDLLDRSRFLELCDNVLALSTTRAERYMKVLFVADNISTRYEKIPIWLYCLAVGSNVLPEASIYCEKENLRKVLQGIAKSESDKFQRAFDKIKRHPFVKGQGYRVADELLTREASTMDAASLSTLRSGSRSAFWRGEIPARVKRILAEVEFPTSGDAAAEQAPSTPSQDLVFPALAEKFLAIYRPMEARSWPKGKGYYATLFQMMRWICHAETKGEEVNQAGLAIVRTIARSPKDTNERHYAKRLLERFEPEESLT